MAEKNTVPNLEAKASDGNQIFTPRQWLERFRQFTKREHKIDITPLIKGEDITEAGWTAEKKNKHPRRLYLGSGTGSTISDNPGRVQNGTGQYQNQRSNSAVYRTLPPETQYIPQ